MNVQKYLICIFCLLASFTPNYAAVEYANPNLNQSVKSHVLPTRKPNFLEKIAFKILVKKVEKTEKKDKPRKGDKLAIRGLSTIIISALLSVFTLIITSGILYYLVGFAFMTGLLMCIIALVKGDLSKKGRTYASWGVGIGLSIGIGYFIYNFLLALKLGLLIF
jgi:hypothetical protein